MSVPTVVPRPLRLNLLEGAVTRAHGEDAWDALRFPIDILKIDREFIKEEGEALFGGIVQLGRSLGLEIVAEGVEHAVQRDRVVRTTCEFGQGYFFARPQPADGITSFLGRSHVAPSLVGGGGPGAVSER